MGGKPIYSRGGAQGYDFPKPTGFQLVVIQVIDLAQRVTKTIVVSRDPDTPEDGVAILVFQNDCFS